MKAKLLAAILVSGLAFWVYRPDNGWLYPSGNFANFKDCNAVRQWVISVQPQAVVGSKAGDKTTPPQWGNAASAPVPNQLVVSPACYYN